MHDFLKTFRSEFGHSAILAFGLPVGVLRGSLVLCLSETGRTDRKQDLLCHADCHAQHFAGCHPDELLSVPDDCFYESVHEEYLPELVLSGHRLHEAESLLAGHSGSCCGRHPPAGTENEYDGADDRSDAAAVYSRHMAGVDGDGQQLSIHSKVYHQPVL